jgi:hypothetical protein
MYEGSSSIHVEATHSTSQHWIQNCLKGLELNLIIIKLLLCRKMCTSALNQ